MHKSRRWQPAAWSLLFIALTACPASADEANAADDEAYRLRAEAALEAQDFLGAVRAYRDAAETEGNVDAARTATRLAFAYRFHKEALQAAKRWMRLEPDSSEAVLYLAQTYFRLGDLRAARRHFAALLREGSEPPGERLVSLVHALSEEGQPEDADKLMRRLAEPYPDSAWAHYAAAALALEAGDTAHAIERAQRAVELEPDNVRPKLLYARALLIDGRQDEAIDYTARIIGDDPDPDSDARMELAIMYMMEGRDDDALSQVNQVLLEDAGRSDALRLMAIINFRQGHLDAATEDFHDLLASGQYRMDALYYLARIADVRQDYDQAIALYRGVLYGSNALNSQRRASALLAFEKDDKAGALQALDEFAATSPAHAVDTLLAKAQLHAADGEFGPALELYDRVVAWRPDDEGIALSRAEILLRMDRVEEAIDAYRAAAKRWPKSALSLNAYGYTLADRTNRYREAEKLIRKALKYDPDSPAIIDSYGWVLFKLGRHEQALAELERAYAGLDDPEVAAHIVEVLVALGRRDEALAFLEAAEAERPDSEFLKDARERLFGNAP